MSGSSLKPAAELARANTARVPNESTEYRRAREQLLAEEIELRRHAERVAELRALRHRGVLTWTRRSLPHSASIAFVVYPNSPGSLSFLRVLGSPLTLHLTAVPVVHAG
jgi:hypothetical protein